jgi:hypothetical protein
MAAAQLAPDQMQKLTVLTAKLGTGQDAALSKAVEPEQDREKVRFGVPWTFVALFAVIVLSYLVVALLPRPHRTSAYLSRR